MKLGMNLNYNKNNDRVYSKNVWEIVHRLKTDAR